MLLKHPADICVNVVGRLMVSRAVQLEKTIMPMVCTPSARKADVSALQPAKARMPMVVMLPGTVTEVSSVQPLKAMLAISVTA